MSASHTADVAVIIVNYNSGSYLARSILAIEQQNVKPRRLIVVDNASDDGSTDDIKSKWERLELIDLDENIGFAAANNLAISRADDVKFIALLNPDAFPDPSWLETLLATASKNPEYGTYSARTVMDKNRSLLDGDGDVYHVSGMVWRSEHGLPVTNRKEPFEIFSACAASALYRTSVLLEVGGFDESFFCYLEDVDLGFRLRLAGHKTLHVPLAVCAHVGSAITGIRSDFSIYYGHRNMVWTFFKNMPLLLLCFYLPAHIVVNVAAVILFIVRGKGKIIVKAKVDAIKGLPAVISKRRKVMEKMVAGIFEIRKAMTGGLLAIFTRK